MADYIVLRPSNSQTGYKFRVLSGGYTVSDERNDTITPTITGKVDVQTGPVLETIRLALKVYHTEPVPGYGSLSDLLAIFRENRPPDNLIVYTDHNGNSTNVYFRGRIDYTPRTFRTSGPDAEYVATVEMVRADAVSP